ncbi:MAG: hypothetical protein AVDCRST_MAG93-8654, partial [uncultured Chloroflexia bacterium]
VAGGGRRVRRVGDEEVHGWFEEGPPGGVRRVDGDLVQRSGGSIRGQAQPREAPGLRRGGVRPAQGVGSGGGC